MFDIGFWEIMILGLVALLVVGPEKLPKLAYTAGKWMGKGRSMLNTVRSEIDKEIKAEELKETLEKQKKSLNPLEEVIGDTKQTMNEFAGQTNKSMQDAQADLETKDSAEK